MVYLVVCGGGYVLYSSPSFFGTYCNFHLTDFVTAKCQFNSPVLIGGYACTGSGENWLLTKNESILVISEMDVFLFAFHRNKLKRWSWTRRKRICPLFCKKKKISYWREKVKEEIDKKKCKHVFCVQIFSNI